jgi:hypothetical protein
MRIVLTHSASVLSCIANSPRRRHGHSRADENYQAGKKAGLPQAELLHPLQPLTTVCLGV